MTIDRRTFATACRELAPDLTDEQTNDLLRFGELVREQNSRVNLVSRRDEDRIESYHILDSLAVEGLVPRDAAVCDIGTGAGFPGIPLAIVRPDIKMTLVDSSQKKCHFLKSALSFLELGTTRVLNDRAESIKPLRCGVVLSRLTASVERLVREAHHHRLPHGRIVLYKTPESAREISIIQPALDRVGLAVVGTTDVTLPITGVVRRFVLLGVPAEAN